MTKDNYPKNKKSRLRERAEQVLTKSADISETARLSPEDLRQLVHELRVHQIELEIQNEELRRAQLAIEQARDRYVDLYDYAPVAYFTLDTKGFITEANLTAVRLFGIEVEAFIKTPLSRLVSRDDQDIFYFHLRQVLETKNTLTCEITLVKKSGEQLHAQLESKATQDDDGNLNGLRIVVTDITERKRLEEELRKSHDELENQVFERTADLSKANEQLRIDVIKSAEAQEALRQSEQRFRAIFEGAEDYVFLKDRSLKYTHVNPAVERLLGVPSSQIIGLEYKDLFDAEGADYIKGLDMRVLEGESIHGEHTRKVNGVPMTFLDTRVPFRDDTGQIVGILSIWRDITDRKRIESPPQQVGEYTSKAMPSTLKSAILASKRSTTILLTGESGSGKDYLAKYIHDHSDRANGPYVSVNCAAISKELAESELFGHERGAFTGAVGRKRGLLELAEGGTLLLNEIGELSLPLQAKLLTFLDTRKFTRVGGEKEISVNASLITATNRDLEKEVEQGGFRKDLFYRINVMSIKVPPLRERREDIPVLVQQFLSKLCKELQIYDMPVIKSATMSALKTYGWPGNVRELRNVLERALILTHGKNISSADLGLSCNEDSLLTDETARFSVSFPNHQSVNEITRDLKRFLVNEALRRSGGSRQAAAKILGISRYSLKHYMKALGADVE